MNLPASGVNVRVPGFVPRQRGRTQRMAIFLFPNEWSMVKRRSEFRDRNRMGNCFVAITRTKEVSVLLYFFGDVSARAQAIRSNDG